MTIFDKVVAAATVKLGLRRLFEQALLILLVGGIVWALMDKARDTRAAAEFAAVQVNLATLRVAMAVDRMHRAVKSGGAQAKAASAANPFLLLERPPANYAGEVDLAIARAGALAPGDWFYDRHLALVGYRVRDTREFRPAGGGGLMLFQRAEPELLLAREPYVWRDQVVK